MASHSFQALWLMLLAVSSASAAPSGHPVARSGEEPVARSGARSGATPGEAPSLPAVFRAATRPTVRGTARSAGAPTANRLVALPDAEAAGSYSEQLHLPAGSAQAQAPFTFALSGGALPACLHLATDGLLSGSPATDCVGTYRFSVVLTSFNGEQTSGIFLLHVTRTVSEAAFGGRPGASPAATSAGPASFSPGSRPVPAPGSALPPGAVIESTESSGAAAQTARSHDSATLPVDCGLLIHSVLTDGGIDVAGSVNKDVVGPETLIAFCRTGSRQPASCTATEATRFAALVDSPDSFYATPKNGMFSAKLLQPLAYGESLNAVLLHPAVRCTQHSLGSVVAAPAGPHGSGSMPMAAGGAPTTANAGKAEAPVPEASSVSSASAPASRGKRAPGNLSVETRGLPAGAPARSAETRTTAAAAPTQTPVNGVLTTASLSLEKSSRSEPTSVSSPSSVNGPDLARDPGLAASVTGNLTPGPESAAAEAEPALSPSVPVAAGADWGRIRATFVGGVLLANDSSQFSSAHQFFELLLEKYWRLPGCSLQDTSSPGEGGCLNEAGTTPAQGWAVRHAPGVVTWFDTRLTAIPVSQNSGSAPAANFLTTQKTARLGVGGALPLLMKRWQWADRPNALFLAPVAKVGFDTLTSSLTQTVVGPNGGTTQATFDRLYNFYAFGGRVGHYQLGKAPEVAPDWQSYLDVVAGRFSNLQSYICEPVAAKPSTYKALPASGCAGAYGGLATDYVDSLKRPYRLDLEGALKIPYLPLLIGFNANLGQHALSTGHIDPAFSTPDDLRFLFATKFDVATLLTRLGAAAASK